MRRFFINIFSILFFLLGILPEMRAGALPDSVYVFQNDTTWQAYKVNYIRKDTVNGKAIAVYAAHPSDTAIIAGFYNGYMAGVFETRYPGGGRMEKIIYQKNKRNGEYTLFSRSGEVIIKGSYYNGIKNGYWAYRSWGIYGKYKEGKKHGKWKWIDNSRKKTIIYFKRDKLERPLPPGKKLPDVILKG